MKLHFHLTLVWNFIFIWCFSILCNRWHGLFSSLFQSVFKFELFCLSEPPEGDSPLSYNWQCWFKYIPPGGTRSFHVESVITEPSGPAPFLVLPPLSAVCNCSEICVNSNCHLLRTEVKYPWTFDVLSFFLRVFIFKKLLEMRFAANHVSLRPSTHFIK
jgi:hypothetical protein